MPRTRSGNRTLILSSCALVILAISVGFTFAVAREDSSAVWNTAFLIRLLLPLVLAAFGGLLASRVHSQKQLARVEALAAERLEAAHHDLSETTKQLEVASERLEREVVDRREAEFELGKANRQLAKLGKRKSDFISAISHELRAPLTSTRNALDLLRAGRVGDLSEKQLRFVTTASRNVRQLTDVIDDLVDLSEIEGGEPALRFEETDPAALLQTIGKRFISDNRSLLTPLELKCPEDLPSVWVDPQRIEQVVVHLLSNAFKFTPAGGRVTVSARLLGEGVEIRVTDTGIGIAFEEQERIFDPFYQVQDPLTRSGHGSGLGLSIVKRLLEVHASTISVDSEPEKGSSFFFTLPAFSPATAEMCAFEDQFQECRSQAPYFSLLVVEPRSEESVNLVGLERLHRVVRQGLPRATDRLIIQSVAERLIVVLMGTSKQGASVVKERLAARIERELEPQTPAPAAILGPVNFPCDGSSGRELLASSVSIH